MALTKAHNRVISGASANIVDYGADATGTVDSSVAIQAAVNASNYVFIPNGTFLIGADITVPSNVTIYGGGDASVLKATANGLRVFKTGTATLKKGITLRDFKIDGGGQTTDVYSGVYGVRAIEFSNIENVLIENITITKMGVVDALNPTDPVTDATKAGLGIRIYTEFSAKDVVIRNCTVTEIAGGGQQNGDGINVFGRFSGGAAAADEVSILIDGCFVSKCGRQNITVEGDVAHSVPSGVKIVNCHSELSSLGGIDIESGFDVYIANCTLKDCGNDQTYYNPSAEYGANYRLMAGIATDNSSKNINISNCGFDGCYYGFTFGATNGTSVSACNFSNSTTSDVIQSLAAATLNLNLTDCQFLTDATCLSYFSTGVNRGFSATGCKFVGTVTIADMRDGVFSNCVFSKGVSFIGSGSKRISFVGNHFNDWSGVGINASGASYGIEEIEVRSNTFYGAGNMTVGIDYGFDSAYRWQVSENVFVGCTTAGVRMQNGNNKNVCNIVGNHFSACANGILISQAINKSLIANNTFEGITSDCIKISGIISSANMSTGPSIMNNITGDSCLNGISISVSTGSYDYTMLVGNNVHSCTGTKWSLASGNANGVVANNITT